MYSIKHLFSKKPIEITAVIITGMNALIVFNLINITADQVSILNVFLVGLLGLFVSNSTINTQDLTELSDAQASDRPLRAKT